MCRNAKSDLSFHHFHGNDRCCAKTQLHPALDMSSWGLCVEDCCCDGEESSSSCYRKLISLGTLILVLVSILRLTIYINFRDPEILVTSVKITCCMSKWKEVTCHVKNSVCWDVMPYGSCKNRRFGGTYLPYHDISNQLLIVLPKRRILQKPHGVTS
jgi:hypothetical protein